MTWRDELRPASFRDVPFHVENADQSGGRRQVVHEFPQRDDAFVEDLGLRPHEFRIEGFVLGADYMPARDALIAALEAAGPGTLVHPYRGALTVSCVDWTVRETTDQGGAAFFSIVFVASAVQVRPVQTEDTGAAAEAEAAAATAEAEAGLIADMNVSDFPAFVAEGAAARVGAVAARLEGGLGRLGGGAAMLSSVSLRLQTLRTDALGLVTRVPNLAGALTDLITSARLLADSPRAALRELKGLIGVDTGQRAPGSTPARLADHANAAALERAVTLAAAGQAVAAAVEIQFDSYDDAVAVRDDLADRLDRAALDLADAGRADDIIARNRVRHPGFVPGGRALEVLTDG